MVCMEVMKHSFFKYAFFKEKLPGIMKFQAYGEPVTEEPCLRLHE